MNIFRILVNVGIGYLVLLIVYMVAMNKHKKIERIIMYFWISLICYVAGDMVIELIEYALG